MTTKTQAELEMIAKDPWDACMYAIHELQGRFELGEEAIATHSKCSLLYAIHALKGPFPLGEKAISKYGVDSLDYAERALKGPFPLGEEAIAMDDELLYEYSQVLIQHLKKP